MVLQSRVNPEGGKEIIGRAREYYLLGNCSRAGSRCLASNGHASTRAREAAEQCDKLVRLAGVMVVQVLHQ